MNCTNPVSLASFPTSISDSRNRQSMRAALAWDDPARATAVGKPKSPTVFLDQLCNLGDFSGKFAA